MNQNDEVSSIGFSRRTAMIVAAIGVVLLSTPRLMRIGEVYDDSYHGNLTAWFAFMAENMHENGFLHSRCMPHLNVQPPTPENYRFYETHPVLDVVSRAFLIRLFGAHEWVSRLNGAIGCLLISAAIFCFVARRLTPTAAMAATVFAAAVPTYDLLGHLSMHHAMTMGLSIIAWNLADAVREQPTRRFLRAVFFAVILLAMQWDWPGWFVPLVLGIESLPRPLGRGLDRRRLLDLSGLVGLSACWIWFHITILCGRSITQKLSASVDHIAGNDYTGFANALQRIAGHQLWHFGWIGLGVLFGATVIALFGRSRGHGRSVLILLLFGALNYIAFFKKGSFEDFWGAYWLLAVAFSAGLLMQSITAGLLPLVGRNTIFAVSGLVFGVAVAWKASTRPDELAKASGEALRQNVHEVRALIRPEDRGVVVSNLKVGAPMLVSAYSRLEVILRQVPADSMKDLRGLVGRLLPDCRGRRVLFLHHASSSPSPEAAAAEFSALAKLGQPYGQIPGMIDITDYVWK